MVQSLCDWIWSRSLRTSLGWTCLVWGSLPFPDWLILEGKGHVIPSLVSGVCMWQRLIQGIKLFTEVVDGNTDSPETFPETFWKSTKLAWYELGATGGFLCYHKGRACLSVMSAKRTAEQRDRGRFPITPCEHPDPAVPEARTTCLVVWVVS